jgi:hypothetical protein
MKPLLTWWMSAPCEFKYAAAGIAAPHVLVGLMCWLGR